MNHSGSCLLIQRDDVKSQITTVMICSRRNENNSLFNVIIVMSRTQMSLYWWQLGPVKQRRFWATNVNRKWTLCILEQLLWLNIQGNCLYKSNDTSVPQVFLIGKGEGLEGKRTWGKGWRAKRKTALPAPFHGCVSSPVTGVSPLSLCKIGRACGGSRAGRPWIVLI